MSGAFSGALHGTLKNPDFEGLVGSSFTENECFCTPFLQQRKTRSAFINWKLMGNKCRFIMAEASLVIRKHSFLECRFSCSTSRRLSVTIKKLNIFKFFFKL